MRNYSESEMKWNKRWDTWKYAILALVIILLIIFKIL